MTAPIVKAADTVATALWRRILQWANLGAVIDALEKKLPFGMNAWPLWSNEGVGGLLSIYVCLLVGALLGWWPWLVLLVYMALRHLYEAYVDIHGYNGLDITWNFWGAVIGYLSYTWVSHLL